MRAFRHQRVILAVAVLVVLADQATKAMVTARISPGEAVDVLGPLRFTLTYNDGVAFGFAGGNGIVVLLLAAVALVALGAFIATAPAGRMTLLSGGLILGGAAGNLIDRIRLGHVTDFILLPGWPAFNLADCAITVGVLLLVWWLATARDGKPAKRAADTATDQAAGNPAGGGDLPGAGD